MTYKNQIFSMNIDVFLVHMSMNKTLSHYIKLFTLQEISLHFASHLIAFIKLIYLMKQNKTIHFSYESSDSWQRSDVFFSLRSMCKQRVAITNDLSKKVSRKTSDAKHLWKCVFHFIFLFFCCM